MRPHPAAELWLAFAWAEGDPAAHLCLERVHGHVLDGALSLFVAEGVLLTDLRQLVRERLFLGRGGRPRKLADYSGRGALQGWLAVLATRSGLISGA